MKKLLFAAFAILLITSCDNDELDFIGKSETGTEIRLNGGQFIQTKAPINNTFTSNFSAGIYARNVSWKAGATANWINNDASTVLGTTGHAVTFGSGPYFYPADGSALSFYAYSPYGSETTPAAAGVSPKVTISMTGQEDIMWASTSGTKTSPASLLTFQHKLLQIRFTFKAATSYPDNVNRVISLKVKAQPTAAVMTVQTGGCSFTGSADMEALSAANQATGILISRAGIDANSPIMTKGALNYNIGVVVKTSTGTILTYSNIPITLTTSTVGNSPMVTLTFK